MMDRSLRAPHALVGRAAELEAVRRLVDGAMDGPATLMLEGEAGIGKTTLWRAGVALAAEAGFRVLSCRPAGAEARLSYAALVDLLEGAVDEPLDDLPDVQRRALDVALLRSEADGSVDPRTVGAAVLGVLRALVSTSPVLIAVDDEQWLDPASAGAIGFAIRRLSEEPVAVIVVSRVREGTSDPMGLLRAMPKERLERVRVVALGLDEMAQLLRERIAFEPAIATLRRIHGVSRGNPFFALELGRALQASGGDVSADGQLPVPEDLRDLLRVRLDGLPASTADVLLLASSMSNATLSLVEAAAVDPDSAAGDLAVAARVGIVEVFGEEVRFVHPLFASAVYAEAPTSRRRSAHRRLAETLRNPEERARHLALAVEGPDTDVAGALDEAAVRALERGAPAAAAELSELAAERTPAGLGDDLRRRRVAAADHRYRAGDLRAAVVILESVLTECPPGPARAAVLVDLGRLRWEDDLRESARLLGEALGQEAIDPAVELKAHIQLANSLMNIGELERARSHVDSAVAGAERVGDRTLMAGALTAQANLDAYLGRGAGRDLLERAERLLGPDTDRFGVRTSLPAELTTTDQLEEAGGRLADRLRDATERGDEPVAGFVHFWLAELGARAGEWDLALRHAAASHSEMGGGGYPWVEGYVRVHRGEAEAVLTGASETREEVDRFGSVIERLQCRMVLGAAELLHADPAAAHRYLEEAWEILCRTGVMDPGIALFLPYGVEALLRLGRPEEAQPLVAWLEERGRTLDRPRALATGARCRGLLLAATGDPAAALASLEEAVRHHERLPDPFELARTLLVQGTLRRRAKQKRPARDALDGALGIFERLGASPWASMARAELSAIGGRPAPAGELTPTEERVARLAAEGRTNREIAEALFLSVRTVEGHLSHVYHKLGVRSRTELAHALDPPTSRA